jgi:hypothetical protein
MGAVTRNILTITEPTIKVDPFDIPDIESGQGNGNNNKKSANKDKLSKETGDLSPAIRVNEYDFGREQILSFRLSIDGFLPSLTVTVSDSKGVFNLSQYPKDGDVLQLFIRSKDEEIFKPIRMDFDIISVDAPPISNMGNAMEAPTPGGKTNEEVTYTFECKAKIPNLLAEECFGYPEDTTFNHLEKVATEMNLGFASNITDTQDKMPRVCPYDTRMKFIKEYTDSAYLDDNSFFTSFIDLYYYLNFVNINEQLKYDEEMEDTIVSTLRDNTKERESDGNNGVESKLFLTNLEKGSSGSNRYINAYSIINNAGLITLKNGYARTIQYYDDSDKEYRSFKIEPTITENLPEDLVPLRGRNDEDRYKTQVKFKYLGKQSAVDNKGNAHTNYQYARINNYQNGQDIYKQSLLVEIQNANMALYRYQKVPLIIYETDKKRQDIAEGREKQAADKGYERSDKDKLEKGDNKTNNSNSPRVNKYLTGMYVIGKIEYLYNSNDQGITQRLTMLRREWPERV